MGDTHMLSDIEVDAIRNREAASHAPGFRFDVSRFTGDIMILEDPADLLANAGDQEPLLGPVMTRRRCRGLNATTPAWVATVARPVRLPRHR